MKKYGLFISFVSVLLVLCLPVAAIAAGELTPKRASIYGVTYQTNESSAFHDAAVYQINDTDFCLVPSDTYTGVSQIRFYFYLDVSSVNSFDIQLQLLDDRLLVNSDGSFTANCFMYNYSNGSFTNYTDIRTNVTMSKSTVDSIPTYHYQMFVSTAYNRNMVMVTIPLAATVVGVNQYINFRVNSLFVNGTSINDVAVTEYNEGFADQISDLAEIEEEMWLDVVAPGIDTWIQDQSVAQAMGDYKQVIQAVSMDNFLVPSLIIIVFSFAFYGFALFGRKV